MPGVAAEQIPGGDPAAVDVVDPHQPLVSQLMGEDVECAQEARVTESERQGTR